MHRSVDEVQSQVFEIEEGYGRTGRRAVSRLLRPSGNTSEEAADVDGDQEEEVVGCSHNHLAALCDGEWDVNMEKRVEKLMSSKWERGSRVNWRGKGGLLMLVLATLVMISVLVGGQVIDDTEVDLNLLLERSGGGTGIPASISVPSSPLSHTHLR